MKSPPKHLEFLDHIRGAAILTVLLFHTVANLIGSDTLPWRGWLRDFSSPTSLLGFVPFSSLADAGVAAFFAVSGFCIHLSFQRQGQGWRGFFIRRFFRLYPAYLAALIFSVLIASWLMQLDFHDRNFQWAILAHVFLIHNLNPATVHAITGSYWSLAVEAQLYLLYPLLLVFAARLGWRKTLFVAAGCELLIRAAEGLVQAFSLTDTLYGDLAWLLSYSPWGFWFSWATGAAVADAFLKKQPLPFLILSPPVWLALAFSGYFFKPLAGFQFLFFAVATASIISRRLAGSRPAFNAPAFSLAVLQKIGLCSYSVYLLHQPLLNIFTTLLIRAVPVQYRHPAVGCFVLLSTWLVIIPVGFFCYKFVEIPSTGLGRRISGKFGLRNSVKVAPGSRQ